ncbi:MAG: UDP-glucose/GDP-mannose dehydrogenase family protein [Gemmatimonadetes bacterium]|nr:MAG: UDP-glucose/GDP-mannose dehydrogenase family protein [Gemmatimonadota bacterium]
MKVAVLGLGYVGCVSATCLAARGHSVVGVDVNPEKVDLVNRGESPIVEPGLAPLLAEVVASGSLRATRDAAEAITTSDVSFVSVGTPSLANGSLDLRHVVSVVRQIAHALRQRDAYHLVAIRSTVLPGTLDEVVLPLLQEESGKEPGRDFGLCSNPEFLREGTALKDYDNPPYTLVGALDERSAEVLQKLYADLEAPLLVTEMRTSEMVKYVSNAFHALKVTFANEIGLLCKAQEIDSHAVMDVFVQDTQLNISAKYLRPGFAFGGSCLPKDLRALLHRAKSLDLELPVLSSILPSNDRHLAHAFNLIEQAGAKEVGFLGLSFKVGTDDLRESPLVRLAERLLGKGYELKVFDRNVSLSRLMGANKSYLEQTIPHISQLLVPEVEDVLRHAKTLVVGNHDSEFAHLVADLDKECTVIDFIRLDEPPAATGYDGICW